MLIERMILLRAERSASEFDCRRFLFKIDLCCSASHKKVTIAAIDSAAM